MFDLNKIVTDALNAAVAEAIRPLVNRIDDLENMLQHKLLDRLAAVENNPAIGVDTTLLDRVVALEEGCVGIDQRLLEQRVALLEERMNNITEASEKRIRVIAEAAAEEALDNHCETYDHDSYDSLYGDWSDYNPSSFVSEDDLDSKVTDAVSDALSNATVSISI